MKTKKFLTMVLALALVCSFFTGFAGKAMADVNYADEDVYKLVAESKDPVHLIYWSSRDASSSLGSRWAECFQKYCESFPDGKVTGDYVYINNTSYQEIAEKIPIAAVAHELPQIMITEDANVMQYQDILLNLNNWVAPATMDNINAGLMQSCTNLEGEKYGVPIGRSAVCLYVNNDILKKYGIDYETDLKTWDGFKAASDKIYAESKGETYGWALNLDWDCWYMESFIYSAGGQFLSDDGSHATFGKDYGYVGAEWLKLIQDQFASGSCVNLYDAEDPDTEEENYFFDQKCAMLFQTTSGYSNYSKLAAEKGFELVPVPQPAMEGCEPSIVSGGACLVVLDNDYDTDLTKKVAAAFIEWMMKDEWVVDFALAKSYFLSTYSAMNDPQIQSRLAEDVNWQRIYDMADLVHKRAASSCWTEITDYLNDRQRTFIWETEGADVYQLIDTWEAKVNEIIENNQ